jgi:hypothetical protein
MYFYLFIYGGATCAVCPLLPMEIVTRSLCMFFYVICLGCFIILGPTICETQVPESQFEHICLCPVCLCVCPVLCVLCIFPDYPAIITTMSYMCLTQLCLHYVYVCIFIDTSDTIYLYLTQWKGKLR